MPLPHNITSHGGTQGTSRWTGPAASDGTLYYINRTWDGRFRAALVIAHNPLPPYFYATTLESISCKLDAI